MLYEGELQQDRQVFQFTTPDGIAVSVYNEDITHRAVDVIVSAANEFLRNVGGIASAIAEAGGHKFQEECTAYVSRHGPLKVYL